MIAKPFATGLVIGKFYPPHAGHHFLIESALSQAETVVVLVCHKDSQKISGQLRVDWLRHCHPRAQVFAVEDSLADDDTLGWAKFTVDWLGYVPAAVFSSEDYGEPYARAMGSTHISVDPNRLNVPISATKIRDNLFDNLRFLASPARRHFVPRICLVGAESTGKTTLAQALAERLGCPWMPEYGREYCAVKLGELPFAGPGTTIAPTWEAAEFLNIAHEHARREDNMAGDCEGILIVDTDAFATGLWQERYLGESSPGLAEFAASRRDLYALYILCASDIPWQQDGTRDGEHIRDQMQDRFIAELTRTKRPWVEVRGSVPQRLEQSLCQIEKALKEWHPFGI